MKKLLLDNQVAAKSCQKSAANNKLVVSTLACSVLLAIGSVHAAEAKVESVADAFTQGSAKVDLNLRYENVSQDNALKDADALTLRTRLTFSTAEYYGLTALVEFEDSRDVAGVNDYNDGIGHNPEYSVIADPNTTELDQAFIQYKNSGFAAKLGRQVIAIDNQRFVGHVGWRQDRQTFDAFAMQYAQDAFKIDYAYLYKRNRIFAEVKDIDSKDHIVNASYKTSVGQVTAYAYLLEEDKAVSNGLDTYGASFVGAVDFDKTKLMYSVEYATQEASTADVKFDADYLGLELGVGFSGFVAKVGYENLGSDDSMYGFSTPLATLHKFNGWTDQFLATPKEGLQDIYASIGGKVVGGNWLVAYHKFDADQASATVDDLGSEVDVQFTFPIKTNYTLGVKYAAYSQGNNTSGKVDTDKVWLWGSASF
ncbi:alginate export family protein [Shewanella aestuarii]|uniref:Alginate export family protein n=1 Tax=Shewanella aestuarii TaxID=1028752 RepID=A0A6G9QIZ2_9GAMM|nr:alginate export family protein [Shewanella aestuarii]QIR13851.1 alginate export family protein [Shewanella aestuarii]